MFTKQNKFNLGFALALFVLTTIMPSFVKSQTAGITTLLQPERSNQILAWENATNQ